MPVHDFWCTTCGQVLLDINIPIAIGATAGAPEHCGKPTAWLPAVGRMDAASGPGFQAFETRDGLNQPVVVDSLHTLRKIERESEQQYRNGEGQPLVWRSYSNDRSNREVHTLHPRWYGGEAPDPAYVKKFAPDLRRQVEAPDIEYGPGVTEDTPSGLDHLERK